MTAGTQLGWPNTIGDSWTIPADIDCPAGHAGKQAWGTRRVDPTDARVEVEVVGSQGPHGLCETWKVEMTSLGVQLLIVVVVVALQLSAAAALLRR